MTDQKILRNKEAREKAQLAIEFLMELAKELTYESQQERLFEIVCDWIRAHSHCKPPVSAPKTIPMSDQESKEFEKQKLTFGKFDGIRIREVPLDYLVWFADSSDQEIKDKIRSYLKSPRIQIELCQEGLL